MQVSGTRQTRLPGALNLAAALLVLAFVMAIALRAQSQSPPAIAEFAPQAQQIKQAPPEQTSTLGKAPGGAATGLAAPSPTPHPPGVPPQAILNQCVGDPPRQIEDPQSPPCIPYWVGHNGGATSQGVNDHQVLIVNGFPAAMVQFFNRRFEFYGRQIYDPGRPNASNGGTNPGPDSPSKDRADANADAASKPFAVGPYFGSYESDYIDQAAKDHVVSVASDQASLSESWIRARAPYAWSYQMAFEGIERNLATWACDRLKGGVASHAGAGSVNKPRVYGLVYRDADPDAPKDTSVFQSAAAACGIQLAYIASPPTGASASDYNNVVINLNQHHVTSVFLLVGRQDMATLFQAADNQQYNPEWIVTGMYWNDCNFSMRSLGGSPNQKQHLFGLTVQPMQRQFADHPSTWANAGGSYTGEGTELSTDEAYRALLLLASGIQTAGPHLTPETFQAGLQRTVFPNPDTPIMAGHVGFAGGSHTMTVDATEIWWSNNAAGPYPDEAAGSGGTWCYVAGGARHSLANPWPRGPDPLFQQPCDSGNRPAGGTSG